MKLYATMKSEKGKEVTKAGNEEINITFTNERRQKFDIKFTGESVEVMRYSDTTTEKICYIHDWDNYGKCCICGKYNID